MKEKIKKDPTVGAILDFKYYLAGYEPSADFL